MTSHKPWPLPESAAREPPVYRLLRETFAP